METETRVYMKYEKLYGSLPIRVVDDPTDRMLSEGDVIKFVGKFTEFKGFYKVEKSVKFQMRKATYNYGGTLYPLILGPGNYITLDMSDLVPDKTSLMMNYRVGIPDDIVVYLAYPSANTLFTAATPSYKNMPTVTDDRAYIGSFTSADSPIGKEKLEITNIYNRENNVYMIVKNDSPTYKKAFLNLIVNKLKIVKAKESGEYIPFYAPEEVSL